MNEQSSTHKHQQSLHVWNPFPRPLTLFLEPWTEEFILEPESGFDLVGDGPVNGRFEVSVRDHGITAYGWTGSVVKVFKNGQIVEPFVGHSRNNGTDVNDTSPARLAPRSDKQI